MIERALRVGVRLLEPSENERRAAPDLLGRLFGFRAMRGHSMCTATARVRSAGAPPPDRRRNPGRRPHRGRAGADADADGGRDVRLTILYTGDLHGRVHPIDALADADLGEGLARVAAVGEGDPRRGPAGAPARFRRHDPGLAGAGARLRVRQGRHRPDHRGDEPHRLRRDDRRQPRVRLRRRAAGRVPAAGEVPLAVGQHADVRRPAGVPALRRQADRRRARRNPGPHDDGHANWVSPACSRACASCSP